MQIVWQPPDYFTSSRQKLTATATPSRFSIGNGRQLISNIAQTCLDETEHELLFVTCFWAESSSRDVICHLLLELARKARSQQRHIRVRICFSSLSISQKLSGPPRIAYPRDTWEKTLGLPEPDQLAGLDLDVTSIFVRPFSVMHPKFVLIDRRKAFLPSCNVSWESWFEGCVEMDGEICRQLYCFWESFWPRFPFLSYAAWAASSIPEAPVKGLDLINYRDFENRRTMQTILLPSRHHPNPRFSPFRKTSLPQTPLNTFIEETLSTAKRSIYIQTPNLTCRQIVRVLLKALERGVHVTIVTSSLLMILEQLATAFTITEFEVWKMRRRYEKLLKTYIKTANADPERHVTKPGELRIGYYQARVYADGKEEPVKTHLKLTVVDEEIVVLGSGNMDRASFFTSQELGVAFLDADFARQVMECTDGALVDRVNWIRDR